MGRKIISTDMPSEPSINLIVAVTDDDWFNLLRRMSGLKEVNFWAPSDSTFKALKPGELFLFKLRAPHNAIVGGGVFTHANSLPCSLAWEAFRESNGATSAHEMRARIAKYRRVAPGDRSDFAIGCRILTQPFRGGRAKLNTPISGRAAPMGEDRARVFRSTEDEQTTTPEPLSGIQGQGGHRGFGR